MIIKSLPNRFGPVLLTALLPLLLSAGCAGVNASKGASPGNEKLAVPPLETIPALPERPLPAGMEFIPTPLSWPAIAPGVGMVTRERADPLTKLGEAEINALTESFRTAYIEERFRNPSLDGVLGGDFIHSWPTTAPLGRVQNWRDRDPSLAETPNTWGIPSLILAIRSMEGNRVFTVRGAILNIYGKSAGRSGANGIAGYGAPEGDEFRYKGGIAQRFEYGLIYVGPDGKGGFIPGAAPAALEALPETLGGTSTEADFREAWKRGRNSGLPPLNADGPALRLDFTGTPWEIPVDTAAAGTIPIRALYYQSFNRGSVLFLLAQVPDFHTRIIAGPFLDAFLSGRDHPLPGADAPPLFIPQPGVPGLRPEDAPFHEAVLRGLARYGLPLTDAVPSGEGNGSPFRETQRFSQGWMRVPNSF
ncbi:hypothetical protein AGMMS49942_06900 [Spirochaetia bacterium]|nr:hypothetical protein AGMMS49942_06900 [Spirochaetia bacterium]